MLSTFFEQALAPSLKKDTPLYFTFGLRYKSCSGYDMMKAFHTLIPVEGKETPPFADPPGVWGAFLNCLTALDRLPFRPGPDGVRAWLGSELVKPFQPLISKSWYSSDSFLRFIWSIDNPTEEPILVTMISSSPKYNNYKFRIRLIEFDNTLQLNQKNFRWCLSARVCGNPSYRDPPRQGEYICSSEAGI